jgi:glycosyltransferase involved in cell wall biosynthesis
MLVEKYPEMKDTVGVVVFGQQSSQLESMIPFPVYSMNYVSSEKEIVDIYNAVDLYVTPSLEDNLPNTIMEAMACGIPCIGFNVGGIPQMIDHLHNGYVARYKSSEDFANGIHWALTESEYPNLSEEACRKVVSNYSERIIAKHYIDIYNKVTGSHA